MSPVYLSPLSTCSLYNHRLAVQLSSLLDPMSLDHTSLNAQVKLIHLASPSNGMQASYLVRASDVNQGTLLRSRDALVRTVHATAWLGTFWLLFN